MVRVGVGVVRVRVVRVEGGVVRVGEVGRVRVVRVGGGVVRIGG